MTVVRAGGDRGYYEAVNMQDELFAYRDGKVYPITNWFDRRGEPCPKEKATVAVAGRGFVWFSLRLSDFGLGLFAEVNDNAPKC